MLVGRKPEQRRLEALLDGARASSSGVLVLRGEAGAGKSALLAYAAAHAADMNVLRCTGIEAEHELPYAGIHQLVRSQLDLIDALPAPQARALRGALGLSADAVDDRFLVSLALLSLLAEISDERPTLCCIDDAQWLDAPSADALVFAARRFEAEALALLFAVREGELRRFDAPGLPVLELGPLGRSESSALLEAQTGGQVSPEVLEMLLTTAAGNPLALLELPAALSAGQLEGSVPILGPPPIRPAIEQAFSVRVAALPESARRVLLTAAADEAGDLASVGQAAEQQGLEAEAELELAERAGLVELDGAVVFRHPLLRSVVYRGATRNERKAAHDALAEVVPDPVSATWHRALVADGADESIAAGLEAAGAQAGARSAHASAAAAFERAADLSEDDARKGRRLGRAAKAAVDAGRADAGLALAERARSLASDPMDQASLNLVQSAVVGRRGTPRDGYELALDASDRLAQVAPDMAVELALISIGAGFQGGWGERILAEVAERIERIDSDGDPKRFASEFIAGTQALLAPDYPAAEARLGAAMEIAERVRSESLWDFGAGPLLFYSVFICLARGELTRARELLAETLAEDRRHGSIAILVSILPLCALMEVVAGRLSAASAFIAEAREIADELGFDNDRMALLAIQARVAAIRGREQECRDCAATALEQARANGIGWTAAGARLALAQLELSLGNASAVLEQFDQVEPSLFPPQRMLATPDLVDAALRAGERARAEAALEPFAAWVQPAGEPLLAGMVARCRGMLAAGADEAERLFAGAEELHAERVPAFERARTQLAHGERLRRDRRRVEARTRLRAALEGFEKLGAAPWAQRARGELEATGETARKRDVSTLDELTPQELRIAQLVSAGATNRDVAAQLFVSPKTVEYHLHKVFLKVGVRSRIELAQVDLDELPGPVS